MSSRPLCAAFLALAVALLALFKGTNAGCPYSALWMPGSANRLPLDHPTMKLYLGDGSHRTLQQQHELCSGLKAALHEFLEILDVHRVLCDPVRPRTQLATL